MVFFEKVFGFLSDHGERSFEVLFLIALVAIINVLAWRFFHHLRD
jgi:hypothetical protein